MAQLVLPRVAVTKEIDGIEMGVLQDGTPYLSSRGLAELCGVSPSAVITHVANWRNGDRSSALAQHFTQKGITDKLLYIETGTRVQAHTENVVLAFLEYYAFHSKPPIQKAQLALSTLLRAGFRLFVYNAVGYSVQVLPTSWQKFHDRLLLNPAPDGYFSVFKEIADFVLGAIKEGLQVDEHTVPDISVGLAWSRYWTTNNLESRFGPRKRDTHVYPEYFPQSSANPIEISIYPDEAIAEFRRWMKREYIPTRFSNYLSSKVQQGSLPASTANKIVQSLQPAKSRPVLPPGRPKP